MDIIKVILASLLSVAALFIITKLIGHKQIAELDFFDYINGITIGSIAAELATELEEPEKPLIALTIYGLFSILLHTLTRKFPKTRKYINGTPTILMNGGRLYRENLKKSKLDLSEFMLLCREAGYFDLEEVQTAIFEPNGKLSILPRAACRPASCEELKISPKVTHIGCELIMDGEILEENLHRIKKDEQWLIRRLYALGYKNPKEVFLAVYRSIDDNFSVYPMD